MLEVGEQSRRGNGLHVFYFSQTGDVAGVVCEHGSQHFLVGVSALVVYLGGNHVDEILLFPRDNIRGESVVFSQWLQKQFPEKIYHGGEDFLLFQRKAVFHKAHEKAAGLHLAVFSHQRSGACAVQMIQHGGNAAKIGVLSGTAHEHVGKQRVFCGFLLAQRTQ